MSIEKNDMKDFLDKWKEGEQLSLYLTTGYAAVFTKKSDIEEIRRTVAIGADAVGNDAMVSLEHVTLAKLSPIQTNPKKGKH